MGGRGWRSDDPSVDGHEKSGIGHTSGDAKWAAEYRSLKFRKGQVLVISGLCPAQSWHGMCQRGYMGSLEPVGARRLSHHWSLPLACLQAFAYAGQPAWNARSSSSSPI